MGEATTIIGPSAALPETVPIPIVRLKENWGDEYQWQPDLEFVSCQAVVASEGVGSCTFKRRYGRVKRPFELEGALREPRYLGRAFVQINLLHPDGSGPGIFVGQISNDARDMFDTGDPDDLTREATGVQRWIAYDAHRVLQRINVSKSIWLDGGSEKTLGWVPGINNRDEFRLLVGNRSKEKSGDTFIYGGTEVWSNYDYLEYLLKRFVEQSGGPTWAIAGQYEALQNMKDNLRFRDSQTVADYVAQLVPITRGIDWVISSTAAGFEVYVYALANSQWSFNDATLPENPRRLELPAPMLGNIRSLRIVESIDNAYETVRVVGNRIVTCCSLDFPTASLERKWTDSLEQEYLAGTGTPADEPQEHDLARRNPRFRPVFQQFGMPDALDLGSIKAAPFIDGVGALDPAQDADHQTTVRRTLRWIPLREGFDYSTDPAKDLSPAGHENDFLPCAVFVFLETGFQGQPGLYLTCEENGIAVSAADKDWGVWLTASPNHQLARNHFAGGAPTATGFLDHDYTTLVATIAFESDQRVVLEYEVPRPSGFVTDGSVLEIRASDAELWYLAPNTKVGIAPDGTLQESGASARILRDDTPRMAEIAAGALARYIYSRSRARIVFANLFPWFGLIASIVDQIQTADGAINVFAPLTSIEWRAEATGDDPGVSTILRTGFAR